MRTKANADKSNDAKKQSQNKRVIILSKYQKSGAMYFFPIAMHFQTKRKVLFKPQVNFETGIR